MKYMTVANKDTLPSREVAKMVDMRHTDLLRNIENYIAVISENAKLRSQDYFIPNTYKVEGNNKTYPCYDITKLGCEMIANKLTGKKGILFTAEYVKRFNEMEQGQHQVAPTQLDTSRRDRAQAMLLNAKTRQAKLLMQLVAQTSSSAYKEVITAKATNLLAGENILPMPACVNQRARHELGYFCKMLGKTANWASTLGKKLKAAGINKVAGETGEYVDTTGKGNNAKRIQNFEWYDDYLMPKLVKLFAKNEMEG